MIAGILLFGSWWHSLRQWSKQLDDEWVVLNAGIWGAFAYTLAHGLVDHSFFLIDLATTTTLLLGITHYLATKQKQKSTTKL